MPFTYNLPPFPSAPSAPLNLTFPPGGVLNDSVTLIWLPPRHPNGVVRFYEVVSLIDGLLVNTTDNSTTTVLSNLIPGFLYVFRVRAFTVTFGASSALLILNTADGEDTWSTIYERRECPPVHGELNQFNCFYITLLLPPSVPSVPQGVMAISNESTSVLVTWMEPAVFFRECVCV